MIRKKLVTVVIYLLNIISKFGIICNLPIVVSIIWYILLRPYKRIKYRKKTKNVIVLEKSFGIEDFISAFESETSYIKFFYLPRTSIKQVYYFFLGKHNLHENKYNFPNSSSILNDKKKCEIFYIKTISHLKKIFNFEGFISFNFKYLTEREFQKSVIKNNLKFLSCHKECLFTDHDIYAYDKLLRKGIGKYDGSEISVYNKIMKKLLLKNSTVSKNKLHLIGMPRADKLLNLRKKKLTKEFFLTLLIDESKGFQNLDVVENKNSNKFVNKKWSNLSYDTIECVLDVAKKYKDKVFVFKTKVTGEPDTLKQVEFLKEKMPDNCKLISSGSGINLIKKASAVLGFNTTGIIESSILNKTTIVPLLNIDLKKFKKNILKIEPKLFYYPKNKKKLREMIVKSVNNKLPAKKYNPKNNDYVDYYIGNIDGKSGEKLRKVIYGLFLNKKKI
ncbi:hypothetical protein OA434_04920 [Candidatus Pelagibacter sp.]|nr:hypothetical protein [Candidatus Pelagibacter sp.]